MILSKNAVGNLMNRYKAVLGKCRLINTFGSLALAVALTLGSVGLAAAAEPTQVLPPPPPSQWDGKTDLTVGTGGSLNELEVKAKVSLINTLTITEGGTVTVTKDGKISEDEAPSNGKLQVQGGTLNINGYSDSPDLQITSGTVNINGTKNNGWRQDALGGYSSKEVNGSATSTTLPTLVSGPNTIVNIASATLFAGGADASSFRQLKVADGATINLMGLSPHETDHTKDFDDAGMLFAKPKTQGAAQEDSTLLITGANTTVNILRSDLGSNHGVFNTSVTNITDGATVNVQGGLLLTGYLGRTSGDTQKVSEAMPFAEKGNALVDKGGSIMVGDKGHLVLNKDMTLDIAADGALTSTGSTSIYNNATLKYSGGTHAMGGTVKLGGQLAVTDAHLDLTGATLEKFGSNPGTAGTIAVERKTSTKNDEMARVDMKDTQLATWLADKGSVTVAGDPEKNGLYARLHLGDVAEVDASEIIGVAMGSPISSDDAKGKVVLYHHGSLQAQNMTLKGAGLTLENTTDGSIESRIKVNSLTLKPDTDFALAKGKLFLKGETGSSLTLVGTGALEIGAASVLKLGEDQNPGGSINANITTNDSTSKVEVAQGKWTLATDKILNIKNGALTVGGGHDVGSAELNIQGALKSSDGITNNNASINVLQNGVLSGDASKFVQNIDTTPVFADDLNKKILVANGGTLRLDGLKTITIKQMKDIKGILIADNSDRGLISYGGATITGSDGGKVTSADAMLTGALLAGQTVGYTAPLNTILVDGTYGADALNITGNTDDVTVNVISNLTLLGNANGQLVTAANKMANVTVADGTNLNLGSTGATSKGGTLNGKVTLEGTGVLNVAAANFTVGDITTTDSGNVNVSAGGGLTADNITAASVTVTGGSLAADNLTVKKDSGFTNGAKVNVGSLVNTVTGNTITVGDTNDEQGGTTLTVDKLNLNGGNLYIDPNWGMASSNVAVNSFTGPGGATDVEINGNVGVGMNSMAAIGTTDTGWLANQVNHVTNGAGLTQNGVDSALGIYSAQVLDGTMSGIIVDGTKTTTDFTATPPAANHLDFSGKSLLVVTAAAATATNGAISSDTTGGTANIADGAKLRITDAKVGQSYTVLGTNIADNNGITLDTNKTGWTGSNFSTDSRMVTGTFDATTGVLAASLNSAANVYPKLDGALMKVLDNAYTADQVGPGHVNSDVKGVRFLSRATNDNFIGANSDLAAKTIESAARIAVAGAVPQMTMAASNAAGAAITQRTSIAQPDGNGLQAVALGDAQSGLAAGDAAGTGFGMWIMPLYQGQNAWSMEAGNNYDLKWHGGLGGVAIGGDYTFANALRAGITFNIGGGYAEGEGDLAKTTNSFNFWGLGAYAGWAMENLGVTADVNYTSTYNKVKQDLPGAMQMSELKSDITAYAISSGLRAEYKFNTQYVDIIPHLGVRYMYVNTDSYDVKSSGTVMNGDSMSQNIWTFPVGVTFSKQVETSNGWYVKPSLDLGVLPATGDIDAKSKIGFTGTGSKAELDTRTMDYMSYTGGLGLDFGNNSNLSFGLNYNIQASEHATSHGVFGSARYEF